MSDAQDALRMHLSRGRSYEIPEITDDERDQLYDEMETILEKSGASGSTRRLHIKKIGEKKPRCEIELNNDRQCAAERDWREKSILVYPRSWFGTKSEWCDNCVELWRSEQRRESETGYQCEECERGAFGVIQAEGASAYLCSHHFRQARKEHMDSLSGNRVLSINE